METKKCFKCGIEKPLDDFYKHPQMKDGHVNKCIDCNKIDVRQNYGVKKQNPNWLEKERKRGREKYARLRYISRPLSNKGAHRSIRQLYPIPTDLEYHHWNYNLPRSVFIVPRVDGHKILHQLLTYDEETLCFFDNESGELLDTKKKHEEFIKKTGVTYVSVELKRRRRPKNKQSSNAIS